MVDYANQTMTLAQLGIDISNPIAIREDDEEEEQRSIREGKKRIRMALCGRRAYRLDAATGRRFWYQISCGYHKDGCPRCMEKRVWEFSERGKRCLAEAEQLGVTQLCDSEAKRTIKELNKLEAAYWRLPTEEGVVLLYESAEYADAGNLSYEDLNWEDLCIPPPGRQHSGKLGRIPTVKEEGIVITCPQYVIDLADIKVEDAWEETMGQTDDLDPEYDVDDLTWACWQRMNTFKELCEQRGGVVEQETYVRLKVSESSYQRWNIVGTNEGKERVVVPEAVPPVCPRCEMTYEQAVADLFIA